MIYFTGKRKYWCGDCSHVFRAVDRRRFARFKESRSTDFLPITAGPV